MADPVFSLLDPDGRRPGGLRRHGRRAPDVRISDPDLSRKKPLERTVDILKAVGEKKAHRFLVGFAAETEDLAGNAGKKLAAKNLDMIVGNIVGTPDSGFGTDTNTVTLFYRDGRTESLANMEKLALARILLDRVAERVA